MISESSVFIIVGGATKFFDNCFQNAILFFIEQTSLVKQPLFHWLLKMSSWRTVCGGL
jgi:hypothetical protein